MARSASAMRSSLTARPLPFRAAVHRPQYSPLDCRSAALARVSGSVTGTSARMRIPYSLTAAVQVTDYSNPAGGAFYFMPSEEVLDRLC